ncbi:MAG: M15 family metallopeptidase [Nitriliruptorales bacterium]
MRALVVAVALAALLPLAAIFPAMTGDRHSSGAWQNRASPAAGRSTDTALSDGLGVGLAPAGDQRPRRGEGTIVIWARGDLSPRFAEAVAGLPQVTATAHVRSSTLGLVASRTAEGIPTDALSNGFRIPVSVAALDPPQYAATLPPGPEREALLALAPGQALLSQTGAQSRRIGGGGEIDLVGLTGLDIVGVVADNSVGRAEIVLHAADAAAAGLDEDGTVFLRHDAAPGAETVALTEQIEALVPADLTARIVDVAAGAPRRPAPLVLSLAQVKAHFGEFPYRPRAGVREIDVDPAFAVNHIVKADVPILGSVTCHEKIIDDLRQALQQIVETHLASAIDPDRYAGCYHPRRISTSSQRLSHHSWGIAIDLNVDLSLPDLGPPPHPGVIAAFQAHGFRWGGDFLHPDNHHFEWVGEATPSSPATNP